jgi:uncharacterized protein YdcH (DUF465 family)
MDESEIIQQLRRSHYEFHQLEEQHRRLEERLEELTKRKVLTPQEEVEEKRLRIEKLQKKDRMTRIIQEHASEKKAG